MNIIFLRHIYRILLCIVLLLCGMVYAAPVSVDELFSKNHQFRILPSFSYINIMRKNPALISVSYPQGGSAPSITIPFFTNQNVNQDYLNFGITARYGVYKRVELFSAISGFWQNSNVTINTIGGNVFTSRSNGDFGAWNLGALIEAKQEGKYPALFVGASADLLSMGYFSNGDKSLQYFKGFSLFATSYYTVDPIVFLVQTSFRFNLQNTMNGLSVNNGEVFVFNPMIYFAVNPYISLNVGIKYQYKTKDSVDGNIVSPQGSSIGYNIGVAYEIKSQLILFTDIERFDTNEYVSNAISLTLSYKI